MEDLELYNPETRDLLLTIKATADEVREKDLKEVEVDLHRAGSSTRPETRIKVRIKA